MSTTPTILFIHGSWHNPKHYDSVRKFFEDAGYQTFCPAHVSTGADPKDNDNWLAADAEVISKEATKIVNEGKDLIVVMHSYGGVIGSEAIHESLSKKVRRAKGEKGGVTELVYLAAFILPEGQSLASALGGELPPYITLHDDKTCWMTEPEDRFFHDLSSEDKKKYTALLDRVPTSTQYTPTTHSAFKYYPSTYLFCTNDRALPIEVQKMMVQMNGGGSFKTIECDSGHSAYLSQPETVLNLIKSIST